MLDAISAAPINLGAEVFITIALPAFLPGANLSAEATMRQEMTKRNLNMAFRMMEELVRYRIDLSN
jgi:hypothetical protein